jgi:hypothetical protein
MGHHPGTHRPAAQEVAVVSRTLNDPRPLACHRPAGPDDSPVLRAILGVPDGITDPMLTRRSCGGKSTPAATRCWSRWSWPASWATRAEQWRGWSTPGPGRWRWPPAGSLSAHPSRTASPTSMCDLVVSMEHADHDPGGHHHGEGARRELGDQRRPGGRPRPAVMAEPSVFPSRP